MKNSSIFSANKSGFDGQFTDLSNNDMLDMRGGTIPPLPSSGGDDYPIDFPKKVQRVGPLNISIQLIPVL
jgi:hypothetical protein